MPGRKFWRFMVEPFTVVVEPLERPYRRALYFSANRFNHFWIGHSFLFRSVTVRLVIDFRWWRKW